jgi:hypothetical protein
MIDTTMRRTTMIALTAGEFHSVRPEFQEQVHAQAMGEPE